MVDQATISENVIAFLENQNMVQVDGDLDYNVLSILNSETHVPGEMQSAHLQLDQQVLCHPDSSGFFASFNAVMAEDDVRPVIEFAVPGSMIDATILCRLLMSSVAGDVNYEVCQNADASNCLVAVCSQIVANDVVLMCVMQSSCDSSGVMEAAISNGLSTIHGFGALRSELGVWSLCEKIERVVCRIDMNALLLAVNPEAVVEEEEQQEVVEEEQQEEVVEQEEEQEEDVVEEKEEQEEEVVEEKEEEEQQEEVVEEKEEEEQQEEVVEEKEEEEQQEEVVEEKEEEEQQEEVVEEKEEEEQQEEVVEEKEEQQEA